MGDMFEKASAIWKALDEMMEKDPLAYQKFIEEQLQQGEEVFGNRNVKGSSSKGTTKSMEQSTQPDISFQTHSKTSANSSKAEATGPGNIQSTPEAPKLLDDDIGGSILSTIVNNKLRDNAKDEGEKDPVLTSLIPESVNKPKKTTAPLIEEL